MFKNTQAQAIIDSSDIVNVISEYISLNKKGTSWFGLCPFHSDSKPSLSISGSKKVYNCFSCGEKGGVVNFIMKHENVGYHKAVLILATKTGMKYKYNDPRKQIQFSDKQLQMFDINETTENLFIYYLNEIKHEKARIFLSQRKLNRKICSKYSIGLATGDSIWPLLESKGFSAPDVINTSLINDKLKPFFINRIVFPVKNLAGKTIGFSGRVFEKDSKYSKYMNTKENLIFDKSSILYNIHNAYESMQISKKVIIVEGFLDVIALDKIGIENVVAIMGTALTQKHASKLKKYNVKLFFDADRAGKDATYKSLKILIENNIQVEVVVNETGLDPDEILHSNGKEKLLEVLQKTISGIDFIYNELILKYNLRNINDIEKFIKEFSIYLQRQTDFVKNYYATKLDNKWSVPIASTLKIIEEQRKMYNKQNSNVNFSGHEFNANYQNPSFPFNMNWQDFDKNNFDQANNVPKQSTNKVKNRINIKPINITQNLLSKTKIQEKLECAVLGLLKSDSKTQIKMIENFIAINDQQKTQKDSKVIIKNFIISNYGLLKIFEDVIKMFKKNGKIEIKNFSPISLRYIDELEENAQKLTKNSNATLDLTLENFTELVNLAKGTTE